MINSILWHVKSVYVKSKLQGPRRKLQGNAPTAIHLHVVQFCVHIRLPKLNTFNIWSLTKKVCHILLETNAQVPNQCVVLVQPLPCLPSVPLGLLCFPFLLLGSVLFRTPVFQTWVPDQAPSITSSVHLCCLLVFLFPVSPSHENANLLRAETLYNSSLLIPMPLIHLTSHTAGCSTGDLLNKQMCLGS